MDIEKIITRAGRRTLTVQIKVETRKGQIEVIEVEPYGCKLKGTSRMFFCLDVNRYEYRNIDFSMIRAATMTRSLFKPRFPIVF